MSSAIVGPSFCLAEYPLATAQETQRPKDAPKAEPTDPKTTTKEPGKGMGMMGDGMMANCPMMGGTPKALDAIKTELGITDAQKSVWEGYAASPNSRPRLGWRRRSRLLRA